MDRDGGAADFGEGGLAGGLDEVHYGGGSELPLTADGCGVIGRENLISGSGVGRKLSSSAILGDGCPSKKRPRCGISKGDNDIWIDCDQFLAEALKLRDKFSSDIFTLDEGRVPGDAFGFCSTEELHLVAGGMEGKHVCEEAFTAMDTSVLQHSG